MDVDDEERSRSGICTDRRRSTWDAENNIRSRVDERLADREEAGAKAREGKKLGDVAEISHIALAAAARAGKRGRRIRGETDVR